MVEWTRYDVEAVMSFRAVSLQSAHDNNVRIRMFRKFKVMLPNNLYSLKLTLHLKMDGWKTTFLLEWPIFRGYVSFRGCIFRKM